MQIKRFYGNTVPEALGSVRREFGKDAIIMETNKLVTRKLFGFVKGERWEVIAAIDHPKGTGIAMGEPSKTASTSDLQKEMSSIKAMLQTALNTQDVTVQTLLDQLTDRGLSRERVLELLRGQDGDAGTEAQSKEDMKKAIRSGIMDELEEIKHAQPIDPSSKIVSFVGLTGVGKTTTIAKIAAMEMLTKNRKIGLITTDTVRVGAIDQLRAYADILQVPFKVAYNASDLRQAIEDRPLRECELILVDTAGRNYGVDTYVKQIRELFSKIHVDETFLVVSCTSRRTDLEKMDGLFHRFQVDKFIFTKFDETTAYGSVIDFLMKYKKPISYITVGQDVPNDIQMASLDKLVNLTLDGVQ